MKLRQKVDGKIHAEMEEEAHLPAWAAFIIGILTAFIVMGMCRG